MGGIRHYAKPKEKPQSSSNISKEAGKKSDEKKAATNSSESDDSKKETTESDTVFEEFYSRKHYKSVTEALEMFKGDPLESKPGSKFLYTTHGFTLISAVLEKAADQDFPGLLKDLFRKIGMNHTYLDFNQPIMPHRTKYYYRDSKHRLHNCPEVNNSYKWGGGGLVSCVTDLLKFAHVILY
uniref:Beta-lactamase-related domain-containing protein n=1 Tax=Acrobeloides nanus TaxID=290746 RepID=A0A914CZG1_9BILA